MYRFFIYILLGIIFSLNLKAASETDSLENLLLNTNNDSLKIDINLQLAVFYSEDNPEKTIELTDELLKSPYIKDNKKTQAFVYKIKGMAEKELYRYRNALEDLQASIEYYHEEDDSPVMAELTFAVANIYENLSRDYLALEFFSRARNYYEKSGDSSGIANTINKIGAIYLFSDDFFNATNYINKSLRIFRGLNDEDGISGAFNNLGILHFKKHNYDSAMQYFSKALYIRNKLGDKKKLSIVVSNIASLYLELEEYEKALERFLYGMELSNETNDFYGLANYYNLTGLTYLKLRIFDKSIEFLSKGLQLSTKIEAQSLMKESYQFLTAYYMDKGEYKTALDYMQRCSVLSDSIIAFDNRNRIKSFRLTYEMDKALRQFEKLKNDAELKNVRIKQQNYMMFLLASLFVLVLIIALVAIFRYKSKKKTNKALTDKNEMITVQKIQLADTVNELELIRDEQYKLIKELNSSKMTMEHDANQLLKLNIVLKDNEKKLMELNATKDKFFSIIAHDLKNPLGSFKNITDIIAGSYEELSDEEKKSLLYELKTSSKHVYELLENLLTWSRSQRGIIDYHPEQIDIGFIVSNNFILLKTMATKKNIELKSYVAPATYVYADMNLVNTVLRNLISNAIKFTPENGKISVYTEKKEEYIEVSVKDSGVGMPEPVLKKLFRIENNVSTLGTSNEKGTGLGLILCKEFVEKNGGKIWAESKENQGSTFFFTLPKPEK